MPSDTPPVLLTTSRLNLALLPPEGAARVLAYHEANREHLGPVSPARPDNFFTVTWWRSRLSQDAEDWRRGLALRLFLLPRESPLPFAPVLGSVSLTDIRRGPLQSCEMGFGLDFRHQGQGLMSEAVLAVCDYAFGPLGLHRIQANHLPENHRSAAVLRRVGFSVEGLARELVLIDGRWRDHVLTAKLAPQPPAG
ncbi:GNAT family N-acetyltransferase [Vitiosangium sp. GDMCC 1.1324]|uniref:GNAT family N-acetyltransferase n=1 Tax=Vitiosangium sp. (strain GDMCC 1.1324) TaxID=2138576 RepID=UPI000D3CFCBE|nr:GNAT family N-acetyltransferase [Vitiosangium sp. GDMCC 1.1324]PTL84650.1 30S ribosomal protein S5 alanine N-acetyltransferase [Vitiosangium sp. GDMCC 1.1324]